MKVKCSKCGAAFEAEGVQAVMVLTGGTASPNCKGSSTVNLVIGEKGIKKEYNGN